jgi:hypothetical protein
MPYLFSVVMHADMRLCLKVWLVTATSVQRRLGMTASCVHCTD